MYQQSKFLTVKIRNFAFYNIDIWPDRRSEQTVKSYGLLLLMEFTVQSEISRFCFLMNCNVVTFLKKMAVKTSLLVGGWMGGRKYGQIMCIPCTPAGRM